MCIRDRDTEGDQPRATVAQIYEQIKSDLTTAFDLFKGDVYKRQVRTMLPRLHTPNVTGPAVHFLRFTVLSAQLFLVRIQCIERSTGHLVHTLSLIHI